MSSGPATWAAGALLLALALARPGAGMPTQGRPGKGALPATSGPRLIAPVLRGEMPLLVSNALALALTPKLLSTPASARPGPGQPDLPLLAAYVERARLAGLATALPGDDLIVPNAEDPQPPESAASAGAAPRAAGAVLAKASAILRRHASNPAEMTGLADDRLERANAALWAELLGERRLARAARLLLGRSDGVERRNRSRLKPRSASRAREENTPPAPKSSAPPPVKGWIGGMLMALVGSTMAGLMFHLGAPALATGAATLVSLAGLLLLKARQPFLTSTFFVTMLMAGLLALLPTMLGPVIGPRKVDSSLVSKVDPDFDFASFATDYLAEPKNPMSVAGMVAALPPDYRENYIIMYKSQSIQEASPTHPRIIAPGRETKTLIAFNLTQPSVEAIASKGGRFDFYRVLFEDGRGKLEQNPKICEGCHKGRPNWDAYDNWALQLPFHRDRIYEGSEEEKAFKALFASHARHPVFGQLKPPPGVSVEPAGRGADGKSTLRVSIAYDSGEDERSVNIDGVKIRQGGRYLTLRHPDGIGDGQAVVLFDRLSELNAVFVAKNMQASPNFRRFEHAVAGILRSEIQSERDLAGFLPPSVIQRNNEYFKMGFKALIEDTSKRRHSLPAQKFALQEKGLRDMVLANAAREGARLSENEIRRRVLGELYRRSEDFNIDETGRLSDKETYGSNTIIAALRYVLEPEDVPVWTWSLGPAGRSHSYTFADHVYSYLSELQSAVASSVLLSRDERRRLSLAAFAK